MKFLIVKQTILSKMTHCDVQLITRANSRRYINLRDVLSSHQKLRKVRVREKIKKENVFPSYSNPLHAGGGSSRKIIEQRDGV